MTLKITSSEILIQNASGQTKFTSNNKLVFPRFTKIGSLELRAASVSIPFTSLASKEFVQVSLMINSSTGNVANSIYGIQLPANGSILSNINGEGLSDDPWGRPDGNKPACSTDYFGCMLIRSNLVFRSVKRDYKGNYLNSPIVTNLTYTARVYSYL